MCQHIYSSSHSCLSTFFGHLLETVPILSMFVLFLVTERKRDRACFLTLPEMYSVLGPGLSRLRSIPWKEGGDRFCYPTNTEMFSIMCSDFSWLRSLWKEREWQGVKENYPTLAEMYIVQYPMFFPQFSLKREGGRVCGNSPDASRGGEW